jgi:phosphatidate cytidylyltransferase
MFAYFAGRAFGRRKLISLSPNKTLEGFIGGLISNVIFTAIVIRWITTTQFWTCMPLRMNLLPYENYQCDSLHPVYLEKDYQLPFAIFGHETFRASPAVIYAVLNTAFASLFAPFAGFWASGFKRANNIKDFGSTLPGHGGFTDRMDCMSFMLVFNFFLMTTFVFKDDL